MKPTPTAAFRFLPTRGVDTWLFFFFPFERPYLSVVTPTEGQTNAGRPATFCLTQKALRIPEHPAFSSFHSF